MTQPVIIDTDPGIDDVIAVSVALHMDLLDIRLITTVGGNVDLEDTTRNTLDLVHFYGKEVPVAKGAGEALMGSGERAESVHGEGGIGGYRFPENHDGSLLHKDHAATAMRDAIMQSDEPVMIVAIAPLTNIALMLKMYPEVKEHIRKIVLMGGAARGGNATPVAEFNIYADPHAAKIVFDAGLPTVMCGLDVTRRTNVSWADVEEIEDAGETGTMIRDMLWHYKKTYTWDAMAMHDLCTFFYLQFPESFTTQQAKVEVVTEGEAQGCTVVHLQEDGPVSVAFDTDVEKFCRVFIETFQEIGRSK